MKHIFTIENEKIMEWLVEPNEVLPGWNVLVEVDKNKEYVECRPISPGTLERSRFDSIKKRENGYHGIGNLIFYDNKDEAEEVLNLEKRMKL